MWTLDITIDGKSYAVDVKDADLVRLEEQDREYARGFAVANTAEEYAELLKSTQRLYRLGFIAYSRSRRRGLIASDAPEVATFDDWLDAVEVGLGDVGKAEGDEPSPPAPGTGE